MDSDWSAGWAPFHNLFTWEPPGASERIWPAMLDGVADQAVAIFGEDGTGGWTFGKLKLWGRELGTRIRGGGKKPALTLRDSEPVESD